MYPPHGANPAGERSLRIVHLVQSATFAGVERYVSDVATVLAARGHRVCVVGDDRVFGDLFDATAVELCHARSFADAVRRVARSCRDADVVHVHMTKAEAAMVVAWPWCHRPVVSTRHFAQRRGSSIVGRAVAPFVRRRVTQQIAISRFVASAIGEASVVIPNGVRDASASALAGRVVLMAQRLEDEKRTEDALLAWSASGLGPDGWELWIAGRGARREPLEALVRELGLVGVSFLGQRGDLEDLRTRVAMVLATAPAEPFGLSVAEAMAAGVPVIAADGGAHRETVGECTPSLLYRVGDASGCAEVLRRVADDVELRRDLGVRVRGFQRANLRLDDHVDRLLREYHRVSA
jgi:glycosyltransferase involved in cell wall biosynthesis